MSRRAGGRGQEEEEQAATHRLEEQLGHHHRHKHLQAKHGAHLLQQLVALALGQHQRLCGVADGVRLLKLCREHGGLALQLLPPKGPHHLELQGREGTGLRVKMQQGEAALQQVGGLLARWRARVQAGAAPARAWRRDVERRRARCTQ